MITDLQALIQKSLVELQKFNYSDLKIHQIINVWNQLSDWMKAKGLTEFNESVAQKYCIHQVGAYSIYELPHRHSIYVRKSRGFTIRAIKHIVAIQKEEQIESRQSPPKNHAYKYLSNIPYRRQFIKILEERVSASTLRTKKLFLARLAEMLELIGETVFSITFNKLNQAIGSYNGSLITKYQLALIAIQYFKFLEKIGARTDGIVDLILKPKKKSPPLKIVLDAKKISNILSSVDRTSAIGKRNYLIILLMSQYGWRVSDVCHFKFNWIDWDSNTIKFLQQKTGNSVTYPLLAHVGNAIIDYVQNGRPESNSETIIVSHGQRTQDWAHPLSPQAIETVFRGVIEKCDLEERIKNRITPHTLRRSAATNLLNKNIELPIISSILGHTSMNSTIKYLRISRAQLIKTILPMPPIKFEAYL